MNILQKKVKQLRKNIRTLLNKKGGFNSARTRARQRGDEQAANEAAAKVKRLDQKETQLREELQRREAFLAQLHDGAKRRPELVISHDQTPSHIDVGPDWIRAMGRHFGVLVPIDTSARDSYFVLNREDDSLREVPVEGQATRIEKLFDAIAEANWAEANQAIHSLIHWRADELMIDVWSYAENTDVATSWIRSRRAIGHSLEYADTLQGVRQHCAAAGLDHVLVKVSEDEASEIRIKAALADMVDEDFSADDVAKHQIREHEGFFKAFRSNVLSYYAEQGYVMAGGNPDAGIALFLKEEDVRVNHAEAAQRAAKIMLRGGRALEGEPFQARLVDFPEDGEDMDGPFGYRDGAFMVLDNRLAAPMARNSGVQAGWSYQGQYVTEAPMKGMMFVVGESHNHFEFARLLEEAGRDSVTGDPIRSVVDVNLWNKVHDTGATAGDVVTIFPEDLWVMESDTTSRMGEVTISSQLIRRAPDEIKSYLATLWVKDAFSFAQDARSDDARDLLEYLPSIGRLGQMKAAGIRPMLDGEGNIPESLHKAIDQQVAHFARKGPKMSGTPVRLFHDSSLSVDTGDQIPGAAVPESWGLEVGDHFLFVAYPVLPALDEDGRSTGVFTCKVESVMPSPHLYLHPQVALWALRDEDGDAPIVHVPEEQDELPHVGIAQLDLSTKDPTADQGKFEIFTTELSGDAQAKSEAVFQVYQRMGTEVGRVDNLVTSAMLYLGADVHTVDTPTDEPGLIYLSKVIQASIERKKHVVDPAYSQEAFMAWLEETLPEAFEEGEYGPKFVHHPDVDVQKPEHGETSIKQHIEAIAAAKSSMHQDGLWTGLVAKFFEAAPLRKAGGDEWTSGLNPAAFAPSKFYLGAADQIFDAVATMFDDAAIFGIAANRAESLWRNANEAGRRAAESAPEGDEPLAFAKAQEAYLRKASMKLQFDKPAQFAAVSAAFMSLQRGKGSKQLKAALAFCPVRHLQVLSAVAEKELTETAEILEALGLDGRHQISASDVERKKRELHKQVAEAHAAGGTGIRLIKTDSAPAKPSTGDTVQLREKYLGTESGDWLVHEDDRGILPKGEFRVKEMNGYQAVLVSC